MFPVAHMHCTLTIKFARNFFPLNDVCIHKSFKKCRKTCSKMIFWPEHAEDISRPNTKSVSDLFVQKKYQKEYHPYLHNWLWVYIFLFYW